MATKKKSATKKAATKPAVEWTTTQLEIDGAANGYVLKEEQANKNDDFRIIRTVFASTDALLIALDKPLRDLRDNAGEGSFE